MKKIKTNNIPLLDELVYYLKKLALSTVLKDQEKADKCETIDSLKNGNMYVLCKQDRANFNLFNYNKIDLINAAIPEYLIDECLEDKHKIPENFRPGLVASKIDDCLNNYVELNNYYRSLNGQPNIDENPIYLTKDIVPKEIIKDINIKVPLHQMLANELELLNEYKVINRLKTKYPDKEYLNYLGFRSIDIFNARIANRFALLYTEDAPKEVLNRYKDKLELNRVYTLKTLYNEAFKLDSDYYDNFIASFIIIQTIVDILSELPDMIIKKEIFDIRTIELIFKSNGVDFFPEIPFKYQLAMVRNINRLIKYKSTTKNIVDICSLFGFDNVKVFKYYLLKDRKVDKYGEYEFHYKTVTDAEGNTKEIEDNMKNYELKFIKVPIDGICDDYINDKTRVIDYDIITLGDKYWDGNLPHEMVKQTIIDKEFNYLQSKYLSIDTVYSITDLSFEMVYFYNMLFDNVKVEEKLKMSAPCLSSSAYFKFVDVICYLYALAYEHNGLEDSLMDTPTKIMYIKGFNFEADMLDLSNYVVEKGFTLEELGVSDFQIPETYLLTYNQLIDIFTKNKNIYDHIVKQLYNADNKRIYDVYKKIYDSLMINKLSMEFFKKKDGTIAKTFTEFIKDRDLILYNSLCKIKNIKSKDIRQEKISDQINGITYALEDYISSDKFKYIYSFLPSVSAEAVKRYVFKVINFFKSYKVDILGLNTIYKFDDKLDNKIKMIDDIILKHVFTKPDVIDMIDKIYYKSNLTKEDKIKMIDKLYMDVTYWASLLLDHDLNIKDKIVSKVISLYKESNSEVRDRFNYMISKLKKYSIVEYYDYIKYKSNLTKEDKIKMIDKLYMDITYWALVNLHDDLNIQDYIYKDLKLSKDEIISLKESLSKIDNTYKEDLLKYRDMILSKNINLSKNEYIKVTDIMYMDRTFWNSIEFDELKYELYSSMSIHVDFNFSDKIYIKDDIVKFKIYTDI